MMIRRRKMLVRVRKANSVQKGSCARKMSQRVYRKEDKIEEQAVIGINKKIDEMFTPSRKLSYDILISSMRPKTLFVTLLITYNIRINFLALH